MECEQIAQELHALIRAVNTFTKNPVERFEQQHFNAIADLQMYVRTKLEESPSELLKACGKTQSFLKLLNELRLNETDHNLLQGIVVPLANKFTLPLSYYDLIEEGDFDSAKRLLNISLIDPIALATNTNLHNLIEPVVTDKFQQEHDLKTIIHVQQDMADLLSLMAFHEDSAASIGRNHKIQSIVESYNTLSSQVNLPYISDIIDLSLVKIQSVGFENISNDPQTR